jgi:endonuclease III
MSAFERLLAIADEEILDLARALLAKPPEHIPDQTNRILRLAGPGDKSVLAICNGNRAEIVDA